MTFNFNINFEDLYKPLGLKKIDNIFLNYLYNLDPDVYNQLISHRQQHDKTFENAQGIIDHSVLSLPNHKPLEINRNEFSDFLIKLGIVLEIFISELFLIESEVAKLQNSNSRYKSIYLCKRQFIQRGVLQKYKKEDILNIDIKELSDKLALLIGEEITEYNFSQKTFSWLEDENLYEQELKLAELYAAFHSYLCPCMFIFQHPEKIDSLNLIKTETTQVNRHTTITSQINTKRKDFEFFDYVNQNFAQGQANYCIYCHKTEKDSCSKGFSPARQNDLGISLSGCPLKQKISEMNMLKAQGYNIGALAIAMIDNPMIAATGHRICNDCSKSCIFQKQEPVDIPHIETAIFESVLNLPYGFEIYSLLTKWNPLNTKFSTQKLSTGYNILVVGAGPAGFTLSAYLLKEGHNVFLIDALKIEPINSSISGKSFNGDYVPFTPIKNINQIKDCAPGGFGGVAEYGITVRWNKLYLTIIRIILERHKNFFLLGGLRFGGNISERQAFEDLKFDHIALCTGASKPQIPQINNLFCKGTKFASDFLMFINLYSGWKLHTTPNQILRLPAAIIGGGLTAVDAATEALAYYPRQVENVLIKYETLGTQGKDFLESYLNPEEKMIAQEFIRHAQIIRRIRNRCLRYNANAQIYITRFLQKLGGVTIYYRGSFTKSQSYLLNHQELSNALKEGVFFRENIDITDIKTDEYGWATKLKTVNTALNTYEEFRARSIIIATGIESHNIFSTNKKPKSLYSYFGDMDPRFSGSVVKAMASVKYGYRELNQKLSYNPPRANFYDILKQVQTKLIPRILKIEPLDLDATQVTFYAPMISQNCHPGQFLRFHILNNDRNVITNMIEPIPIAPFEIDKTNGIITSIIFHRGTSSSLISQLTQQDQITLTGPNSLPITLTSENILLIGEGYNNAVLTGLTNSFKNSGANFTYITNYIGDKMKAIVEQNCKKLIIYNLQEIDILLASLFNQREFLNCKQVIIAGSAQTIKKLQKVHKLLREQNKGDILFQVILHYPMQCMMQGLCGSCLQELPNKNFHFTCSNIVQNIENIALDNVLNRNNQNTMQEKLNKQWLSS